MIELQPYRPEWDEEFRRESVRLTAALGDRVDAIEHIGSTAVPGLVAKPIIDLAARVAASVDPFDLGEALRETGYVQHTAGPKTHGVYVRHDGERRTHILHVFAAADWEHANQRLFRDRLVRDPSARERYAALKLSLIDLDDGRNYTAAKRDLIAELLSAERAERGLPPTNTWDK